MNRRPATPRTVQVLAGACAAAVLLSGCNAIRFDEEGAGPVPSASPSPTVSSTPVPSPGASGTVSASPASPSGTPEPTGSPTPAAAPEPRTPASFRDRLLTAEEMPSLDTASAWRLEAVRGREGSRPFGTCQEFDMLSVGATRVAVATYVPDGPLRADAGHLVVDFVDAETARRAYEVLRSWRRDCAADLTDYPRIDVGRLTTVPGTGADAAGWYLLRYGPVPGETDADYVDAQGMVLAGTRIAMLEMQVVAPDPGSVQPPMAEAVRRAAGLL